MEDVVFLNNAILIIGIVVAMGLNLFGVKKKTLAVTFAGLCVFVATLTYAILLGATLYESGTVCVFFLVANLIAAKE